jgi:hypothetical protein
MQRNVQITYEFLIFTQLDAFPAKLRHLKFKNPSKSPKNANALFISAYVYLKIGVVYLKIGGIHLLERGVEG